MRVRAGSWLPRTAYVIGLGLARQQLGGRKLLSGPPAWLLCVLCAQKGEGRPAASKAETGTFDPARKRRSATSLMGCECDVHGNVQDRQYPWPSTNCHGRGESRHLAAHCVDKGPTCNRTRAFALILLSSVPALQLPSFPRSRAAILLEANKRSSATTSLRGKRLETFRHPRHHSTISERIPAKA
jgi:hypothetical protein